MKNHKSKSRVRRHPIISASLILFFVIIVWGISVISQGQEKRGDDITRKDERSQEDTRVSGKEEQKLIEILKKKKEPKEVIFMAIQKLGDMRSKMAIPELIEYLDYEKLYISTQPEYVDGVKVDGHEIGKTIPLSGRYPAAGALFRIGTQALPSLVRVIENEEMDSIKSQNALYAIDQIFVEDKLKAVLYLEKAIAASTTPDGSRRLNFAAQKIREGLENPKK